MDKTEFASRTNQALSGYIVIADTKAGLILTLTAAIFGGLGAMQSFAWPAKVGLAAVTCGQWLGIVAFVIATIVATVAGIASLHKAFVALSPRTNASAMNSLSSFPNIAAKLQADFVNESLAAVEDEPLRSLSAHNWVLSSIAQTKFANVNAAFRFLAVMVYASALAGLGSGIMHALFGGA